MVKEEESTESEVQTEEADKFQENEAEKFQVNEAARFQEQEAEEFQVNEAEKFQVKEEDKFQELEADKFQDEKFRKLFVGALSLSTTNDSLKDFYSQYGTVIDSVVMFDHMTSRSRGFGLITLSSMDEVDKAMQARPHEIDGKVVDPKRAVPREQSTRNEANVSTKRLYVSGIREDHEDSDFQEYFGNYGTVEKVEIIKDKATGQYRGFAFISFSDYDPVDKCVLERRHMIKNHRCDVKKALSREEIMKAQQMDRDRANRASRSRGTSRPRGGFDGGRSSLGYNNGGRNSLGYDGGRSAAPVFDGVRNAPGYDGGRSARPFDGGRGAPGYDGSRGPPGVDGGRSGSGYSAYFDMRNVNSVPQNPFQNPILQNLLQNNQVPQHGSFQNQFPPYY